MKRKIIIIFLIFTICIFALFSIFNFVLFPKKYKNFVVYYSEKYSLEISLVYAIIKTESNFDKTAVSNSNAMGLMQIIPSTAKWIAESLGEEYSDGMLFDAETNIRFGCFYLNYLFNKFNDVGTVICAYNAGESVVRNWFDNSGKVDVEKITFLETKNYYKKVIGYYNIYKNKQIVL